MKVSLITCHVPTSKRKAGFHWIADAFHEKGWNVDFITCYSTIDVVKGDYRAKLLNSYSRNEIVELKKNFRFFISRELWRPVNLKRKFLNGVTGPFFSMYKFTAPKSLKNSTKDSDIIIFESIPEIMYLEEIKKINPSAKFVYRVSDDLATINIHPIVLKYEEDAATIFDLVSVPNKEIYNRFSKFCDPVLHKHGLPKKLFDGETRNPYKKGVTNVIFVGSVSFDHAYLEMCSRIFPELQFHIIGPIDKKIVRDNVIYYGEMEYVETIPYIKEANVAISPVTREHIIESNKIIQYTYCRLPIITSEKNKSDSKNIFYYKPGDLDSIKASMNCALSFDRSSTDIDKIWDWMELVDNIIDEVI